MPVERHGVSRSMFCELLGLDPARFVGLERTTCSTITIVQEPEMSQTIGTLPQASDNTIRRKPSRKGGKKR